MLYIQKSVSENAGIAVIGVEKCKNFPGENTSRPPTNKRDITPNFLLPTTIYHFSTLGIVWSLFVDGPPTDEFLKNALLRKHGNCRIEYCKLINTVDVYEKQIN